MDVGVLFPTAKQYGAITSHVIEYRLMLGISTKEVCHLLLVNVAKTDLEDFVVPYPPVAKQSGSLLFWP